ncbi:MULTISPECIES: DUF3953 domain-containing protein [unclassified Peribacillus]|uniref:DUF3953 domain-containing protein n=1 Tax=unclassified Peribacillus TaxID=2675266 RepID=UPI00191154DB|nr:MULTISPECIES: DUF3953 domain-containing protein [unclassified Peribacillus]MBK5443479.1 DUF3953 domain-containing protein [Peribacillus sp. TH24]MBK5461789.1 DUF3953 domain-containing protein [Peribacillus sp. TH27]
MLKILRIVFSIIVLTLSGYGLITGNFKLSSYMIFFLGALMLVTGLAELQKDRKRFWGYMSIIVSLYAFFVSIQGFLLN